MLEPPEGTKPQTPEEILAGIHAGLQSKDIQTCLNAIQQLGEQKFSSPAILRTMEGLALKDESEAVREAARQALTSPTHRYIQGRTSNLDRKARQTILAEITSWEVQGLISSDQADVIRHRYDFDLTPAPVKEDPPDLPMPTLPASVKSEQGEFRSAPPRPGLTQTLLSETSIKIALYLGAFFVIAAAVILATVLEAARLPILLAATALFAGGAILTRSKLQQPSFALFIVFSFLLPTDANVLADVLNLTGKASAGYWFAVMAVIAVIWSFGTWFYASRLFSLAAFIALAVSVVRLGEFLEAELELYLVLLSFVGLVGLGGVFVLRRWRSTNFSLPLFILIQVSQIGLVTFALVTIVVRLDDLPSRWTLLSTLFWLLAMAFYVLSDLIFPFVLFPWLSVAALYPLPLNFMLSFDVEPLQVAMATWFWGLLLALTSEIFSRFQADKLNRYRLPSLAGSGFVILTAIFIAYFEDISYGFAFLLGSSILYVLLHLLKPRAYVWTAALLLGLGAYFSFFALPLMESIDFFVGFQLLGVSLLLLGPDLFFDPDFFANKTLRWPLRILGAVMAFLNLVWLLSSSTAHFGEAAVCYSIYAIFFALYALKFNRAWLGYIATLSAAIAVGFAILHFEPDAWMLTLTALAAIYYISGFTLGRGGYQSTWSDMLRYSGLGLTSLVSIWAIIILEQSGGWYVLIAALAFGIELFTRRVGWAEAGLQGFLASGVYLLLQEADMDRGYQGLGIAMALLGTDLVLGQIYAQKRTLAWVSRGVGALVVILNMLVLFFGVSDPLVGAVCFGMYMLFFLAQTLLYRQPVLGYGFSLFSVLTVIFTLQTFDQPKWILPATLLAALFYAAGFLLRKKPIKSVEPYAEDSLVANKFFSWSYILWTSGLGAGLLATVAAPIQGGLSAAIPTAVTATMVAVEAFDRRNVWLGFPANALYLTSYFILLLELNVSEPQFFSIAIAILGILMHYLLVRAGSRTGAFITGMVSQLVLLSTTYIQFFSTERIIFFFAIFFQALVVLAYGVVIRSRSLVITPLVFLVLSVLTVAYGLLQGILTIVLIGCTGLLLLMLGILAVVMRDRFKQISERFRDWGA